MIFSGKQKIEKFPGTLLVKSKLKYIQVSIKGNSMSPTFKNGDLVIFEENNGANLKINDIVLFNHPFRNNKKIIHKEEKQIISWARESVVSIKNIKQNDILNNKNLSVKRPAPKNNEIPAKLYFQILGKKAKKNIAINRKIKWTEIK